MTTNAKIIPFPRSPTTLEDFADVLLVSLRRSMPRLREPRFFAYARRSLAREFESLLKFDALPIEVTIAGGTKLTDYERRATAEAVVKIAQETTWNRTLPLLRRIAYLHVQVLHRAPPES